MTIRTGARSTGAVHSIYLHVSVAEPLPYPRCWRRFYLLAILISAVSKTLSAVLIAVRRKRGLFKRSLRDDRPIAIGEPYRLTFGP